MIDYLRKFGRPGLTCCKYRKQASYKYSTNKCMSHLVMHKPIIAENKKLVIKPYCIAHVLVTYQFDAFMTLQLHIGRKYRVSAGTYCVSAGVIRQPRDRRLLVYTSLIPVSAAAYTARATVSVCNNAAEVGNAVGTGFPAAPDASTGCGVSM